MKPHLPTIAEITAAARESAQKTPRPGAAFWREAIRAMISREHDDAMSDAVHALATKREYSTDEVSFSEATDAILARLDGAPGVVPLPEADLRAVFVELQILASDDEDDARRRWGNVFGLGSEGS